MLQSFSIGNRRVGEGEPAYIIAELSANHNQDLELAFRTIRAAAETGADAIKLQTYTADTITLNSRKSWFQIQSGTLWDGTTLYDLYQEAYTPWEWHAQLMRCAADHGLQCFSSPFDPTAVDFLAQLQVPVWKIASFEITDIPLIEYTARQGQPIIISTGIAEWHEIQEAVDACRRVGNSDIALLKCTSSYPAPLDEVDLRVIPTLRREFGTLTGLSDHTMGTGVPVGAVALGACIIEKHFILDRGLGGPDSSFSLNPAEFTEMVTAVRNMEKALGSSEYTLRGKSRNGRVFSRSLFTTQDIRAGETFTEANIRSVRPGHGLAPRYLHQILGKKATCDIEAAEPLRPDMIEGFTP